MNSFFFLCVAALALTILSVQGNPGAKDDFLTDEDDDKPKIAELRNLLGNRAPHDYQKTDDFLIRFLKETDMDVPKALEMILAMLRWREENKIDTIGSEENEDFKRFDTEFHSYIEGCDKGGRPVVSVSAKENDVSKEIEAGKEDALKRYGLKAAENAVNMLRRMNSEGEKVSQTTILIDLKGFTLANHACPLCIPLYIAGLKTFQANYPGYIHKVIAINAPSFALPLWDTYKKNATPRLRESVHVFGENEKAKWTKLIDGEINASQRTAQFGGSRDSHLDVHDLQKSNKAFKCATPFSDLGGSFL